MEYIGGDRQEIALTAGRRLIAFPFSGNGRPDLIQIRTLSVDRAFFLSLDFLVTACLT
jgi:hypothetical protein